MKYFLIFTFLTFTTLAYSQTKPPKGDTTDYIAMGVVNGCKDGSKEAAAAQHAYNTVMNNSSIRADYKDGYREGWGKCRENAAKGSKVGNITLWARCYLLQDESACKKIINKDKSHGGIGNH